MKRRDILMKKRYIVLIVIAALLVCTGSFLLITKGRVSVKDGLRQNSCVYMTDIKLENGEISYTVVNKTFRQVGIGDKPGVQKKINGEWQFVSLYKSKTHIGRIVKPFSDQTRTFEVEKKTDDFTGEYRLIYGTAGSDVDRATGKVSTHFFEDQTYIVGYFTITEDMLAALSDVPDDKTHYTDGIRQSELMYVKDVQYADGEITYTLVNETDERIYIDHVPAIEKKVNGEWKYVPLCQIADKDHYSIDITQNNDKTYHFSVDPAITDLAGEYRLIFTPHSIDRWLYTDPDTGEERLVILEEVTCLVGYLTITEDMLK